MDSSKNRKWIIPSKKFSMATVSFQNFEVRDWKRKFWKMYAKIKGDNLEVKKHWGCKFT